MRDDDSSMVLFFDSTASRQATAHSLKDMRLLAINCPVVAEMLGIVRKLNINAEGTRFESKPSKAEAHAALAHWLREFGASLAALGLGRAARDAVNPLPPGMKPGIIKRIFVSSELPDRAALAHLLWCLGISPHAITGAMLLLDYATGTRGLPDSSKTKRAVAGK
jgi:hypothetical protein